ncbi:hypothetical protein VNO80_25437 [Phaseolus coccineus]|uniref:Pentatricopeptide repeat-containing protein n=1 Tax=Phaseolus coccineus TaxID=3886 RepID=A0AAN9QTD1_PHACN
MLDVDCDQDEVAFSTMLSSYASWGRQKKFTLSGGRWGDVLPMQWPLSHFTKAAEYAFKTFDEMRNNGVIPEKAENFIHRSLKENLELDIVAYNTFINAMLEAGMMFDASQFSKMQEEGIEPGKCFSTDSLPLLGNAAEETLHAMHSKGIPPSCVHFYILLHAFTKAGLIDEAKRVNEELQPKGEVVFPVFIKSIVVNVLLFSFLVPIASSNELVIDLKFPDQYKFFICLPVGLMVYQHQSGENMVKGI